MSFKGNKQTATYHDLDFVQDRCAIDKMPQDKLVTSETEFSGAVEGRAAMRNGNTPTWKICAHCKRARDKANAPAPEPVAAKEPKVKKETAKARKAREAAEAIDMEGGPEAPTPPETEEIPQPVDLFAP